jgi:hypothetical protein
MKLTKHCKERFNERINIIKKNRSKKRLKLIKKVMRLGDSVIIGDIKKYFHNGFGVRSTLNGKIITIINHNK